MIFTQTPLRDAFVLDLERLEDERGFFARTWCGKEFAAHGLNARLAQCSTSMTKKRGTLRGMHYQTVPFEEAKLVRCTRGSVHDVIVDIRPESSTYSRWFEIVLSADNRKSVYVPEGFAHGFLTLEDDTEVFYQISQHYSAEHARGFRWDDPLFGIKWPFEPGIMSERDRTYADFSPGKQ
jgi:dTDP-4-dehydrorhamnose 3,5-epimerase